MWNSAPLTTVTRVRASVAIDATNSPGSTGLAKVRGHAQIGSPIEQAVGLSTGRLQGRLSPVIISALVTTITVPTLIAIARVTSIIATVIMPTIAVVASIGHADVQGTLQTEAHD
jgi:hypothetical protein